MWNAWLFRSKYPPGSSVKIIDDGGTFDLTQRQMIGEIGTVVFIDINNEWVNVKTDTHQSDFYDSQLEKV